MIDKSLGSSDDTLGLLLEGRTNPSPAAGSPLTRVQQLLMERWPDAYVCRLRPSLELLRRWMASAEVVPDEDGLHEELAVVEDAGGARAYVEGGWVVFRWRDALFRAIGIVTPGRGGWEGCAWLVAPDRAAAHALVEAVAASIRELPDPVMVFENGDWEKAPRLQASIAGYSWEAVILPEATRDRMRSTAELFFKSGPVYADLGIPWKLGMLLVGPPGTGKTLTTKILANNCGVPFLYVRGLNGFYGAEPEAGSVREMFRGARDRAPCILCLEDVDTLVTEGVRSVFLNELDGLEEDYRGVLIVATTNHAEKLDPALLQRPSRFDYRIAFPLPNTQQRSASVRQWIARLASLGYVNGEEVDIDFILRRTRGMTHAYLKRVMVGVALRMHHLQERGDAAFNRLAAMEIDDARRDRHLGERAQAGDLPADSEPRVGFRRQPD